MLTRKSTIGISYTATISLGNAVQIALAHRFALLGGIIMASSKDRFILKNLLKVAKHSISVLAT